LKRLVLPALGRLGLVLVSFFWLVPYAWMVITSLKTLPEIVAAPTAPLPAGFELGAYHAVFESMPVVRYFVNTTLVALGISGLQLLLAVPAGYALSKLRFRGRTLAFALVLSTLLVPAQVRFVPVFTLLSDLGLTNTLSALILPFGVSALGTFLVRQALLSLPDSIIEAARIDGASEFRIVYRILPPLLVPTLVSLFLFSFVFHWNDYFWPLVMSRIGWSWPPICRRAGWND
jgi:sn-glycerol 3-phosphate transport system permease protein